MPVSGKELASLDFANLIGGPLNAVVEAQAKSAITTVNFIKEVAFDDKGNVVNVDFSYSRKNDNGSSQDFKMTVPFLTMLPVPYITVSSALVEFNAKITSTTTSSTTSNLTTGANVTAGANWWFGSARLTSKTSYQKKSASSDREERTFDMKVRVEAKNQDMPAGTERILTILENSIDESAGPIRAVEARIKEMVVTTPASGTPGAAGYTAAVVDKKQAVIDENNDINKALINNWILKQEGEGANKVTVTDYDAETKVITFDKEVDKYVNKTVDLVPAS